jgi:hypothetical protein
MTERENRRKICGEEKAMRHAAIFSFATLLTIAPTMAACPGVIFHGKEASGTVTFDLDARDGTYHSTFPPSLGKTAKLSYYTCDAGKFRFGITAASDGNDCTYEGTIEGGKHVNGRPNGQTCNHNAGGWFEGDF